MKQEYIEKVHNIFQELPKYFEMKNCFNKEYTREDLENKRNMYLFIKKLKCFNIIGFKIYFRKRRIVIKGEITSFSIPLIYFNKNALLQALLISEPFQGSVLKEELNVMKKDNKEFDLELFERNLRKDGFGKYVSNVKVERHLNEVTVIIYFRDFFKGFNEYLKEYKEVLDRILNHTIKIKIIYSGII